ncbi:FG-GAP-like repeat-containing protein [Ideonella sp.]|uniref:FG-GAP-like repeat-containing protein n=1 Tax=Ideonella sp. TaxID=1929293 RepID=UPI0035B285BC
MTLYLEGMTSPERAEASILSAVVIRFGEPLDAASVTPDSVALTTDAEVVATRTEVSGNLITLTPVDRLRPGTHYRVMLAPSVRGQSGRELGVIPPAQQPFLEFTTESWPMRLETLVEFETHGSDAPVAVGDFDGDGLLDLAVAREFPTRTSVLRGLGHGKFAPAYDVPMNESYCRHSAMRSSDINGDGWEELVISAYSESGYWENCGVTILSAQGARSQLAPSAHWVTTDFSIAIKIADVDADGLQDLVGLGRSDVGSQPPTLVVWTQQDDGSFSKTHERPVLTGGGAAGMTVGDLSGDGLVDFVAWCTCGRGPEQVWIEQSAPGVFGETQPLTTVQVPYFGATAWEDAELFDANADGRLDIVASTGGNYERAVFGIYYQDASGLLAEPVELLAADHAPGAMDTADMNDDGVRDLVVFHDGWQSISAYLPQADGQVISQLRYMLPIAYVHAESFALADLNGDRWPDIVVNDGEGLKILFQIPTQ